MSNTETFPRPASTVREAEGVVADDFDPDCHVVANEATGADGVNYFDVLVWAHIDDSDDDDGQKAIARYRVAKADRPDWLE